MANENFENMECVCAFVNAISGYKSALVGFLDVAIAFLKTTQGLLILIPKDLGDYVRGKELELELVVLETGLSTIGAPLGLLRAYTKPWADCPPVATLASTVNNFYKTAFSDIIEKQFEVEKQLQDIKDENEKSEEITLWIGVLEDFKDAIEYCAQTNTTYEQTSG